MAYDPHSYPPRRRVFSCVPPVPFSRLIPDIHHTGRIGHRGV